MKKLLLLALGLLACNQAFAGNIVSGFSHSGLASVSATADKYVWTRGGSPRTGYYYYWRDVREQTSQGYASVPLPGGSNLAQAIGTYYSPSYSITGAAVANFSNSATTALYSVNSIGRFVWNPALPDHAAASESISLQDIFNFTVATDTTVTVTPAGTSTYHIFLGGGVPDEGGSSTSNGPITMVLLAGSYYMEINASNSVADNTQTGLSQGSPGTVHFGYTMSFMPANNQVPFKAVPEPCTIAIVGFGGIVALRRRRRN